MTEGQTVDGYYGENEDYDSELDLSFLNDEGKDAEQEEQ